MNGAPSLWLARSLARLGDGMRRHAGLIRALQWAVVLFYAVLLIVPACLELPPAQARMLDNLAVFAQFVFWGIWWPFVLLSMLLFGRLWCGLFCPEGALSEWASRHGRGRGVPRWMRWGGWPFLAFCLTTLYGQLISVYDYALPALLILGGSTLAAMLVGFLYGRGKRVWCRYLCPVSGVFNLLARLAPVHFRVDEARWLANAGPHLPTPNCAPLIDIRRQTHIVEEARAAIERVGLSHIAERPLAQTSYGERRRVEIAMALAQNPKLLLLDEPFAGLSIDERRDVHRLLMAIPRDVTMVMIEHNMDVALEFAERITLLHFGEVIVEGTRAEVVADPRTREVYLGH